MDGKNCDQGNASFRLLCSLVLFVDVLFALLIPPLDAELLRRCRKLLRVHIQGKDDETESDRAKKHPQVALEQLSGSPVQTVDTLQGERGERKKARIPVPNHFAHQKEARNIEAGYAVALRPDSARLEVALAKVAEGADEVDDRQNAKRGEYDLPRVPGAWPNLA